MADALWQLLRKDPPGLTCKECFGILEYYAELLAQGGGALLPEIMKHLAGCPPCQNEHRAALQRLLTSREGEASSTARP